MQYDRNLTSDAAANWQDVINWAEQTGESILGNTEQVARAHYGRDSGEQAAKAVRSMLLAEHPDIFNRMKRAF